MATPGRGTLQAGQSTLTRRVGCPLPGPRPGRQLWYEWPEAWPPLFPKLDICFEGVSPQGSSPLAPVCWKGRPGPQPGAPPGGAGSGPRPLACSPGAWSPAVPPSGRKRVWRPLPRMHVLPRPRLGQAGASCFRVRRGGLRTLRDSGPHALCPGSPPRAPRLRWECGLGRRLPGVQVAEACPWRRGRSAAGGVSALPAFCFFFVFS